MEVKHLFPAAEDSKPLYYVGEERDGSVHVYHRPVVVKRNRSSEATGIRMGFRVCKVAQGIDPEEVAALLNKAEPPTPPKVED